MIQNTYHIDYMVSYTKHWKKATDTFTDVYKAIEAAVSLSKKDNILKTRVYDFTNEKTVLLLDKSYM